MNSQHQPDQPERTGTKPDTEWMQPHNGIVYCKGCVHLVLEKNVHIWTEVVDGVIRQVFEHDEECRWTAMNR